VPHGVGSPESYSPIALTPTLPTMAKVPRPTGAEPQTFGERLWARLRDPANLATVPVIGLFFALRPLGLIAAIPYWTIVVLLLGADLLNTVVIASLPRTTTGWPVVCRVWVEMAVIAVVVYGIGWGPLLAVGFVFCAADAMRSATSDVAKPAIVSTAVLIGLGQLAIFLGLAPTLVSQPLVHGLGALGGLGAIFTIKVLQWFAVGREVSEERFKVLVQNASDKRARRTSAKRHHHDGAEDAAIMSPLKYLCHHRPHDGGQAVTERALRKHHDINQHQGRIVRKGDQRHKADRKAGAAGGPDPFAPDPV